MEYAICKKLLPDNDRPLMDGYNAFSVRGKVKGIGRSEPHGHPHSFISEYQEAVEIGDYMKFTVLRDPFAQVTSLYNQVREQLSVPSLEHFILSSERNSFTHLDHYINQYKYTHIDGNLAIDKVFVFDRYHEAQSFVEGWFDLKINKNKKLWATAYTSEQWTGEMRDKFASVHHQSIELYERFCLS